MKFLKNILKATIGVIAFLTGMLILPMAENAPALMCAIIVVVGILLFAIETTYPKSIERTITRFVKW